MEQNIVIAIDHSAEAEQAVKCKLRSVGMYMIEGCSTALNASTRTTKRREYPYVFLFPFRL